jgi:hypothetical protein
MFSNIQHLYQGERHATTRPRHSILYQRRMPICWASRTVKIFESFLSTVIMSGNMAIFEMDDRSGETAFNLEYIPVYSRVMKRVVNRKPLGGGRSQ